MTNEEALKNLKRLELYLGRCNGKLQIAESIKIAICAVGKQIQKKPNPIFFDNKLMCGECIICGNRIGKVRYCPSCGQATDWSE